ncbi:MAG: hypothetical protein V1645_03835 [archaeon]
MDKLEKILGEYQKALAERQEGWDRNYSQEVCEALKHETEIMACELENLIKDGYREDRKIEKKPVKQEPPSLEIYEKKLELDIPKVMGLPRQEESLLRYMRKLTITRNKGKTTLFNSSNYGQLRKFVFGYWKKHKPELLKKIIEKTKDDVWHTFDDRYMFKASLRKHFKNLSDKPIKAVRDIQLEELEKEEYLQRCPSYMSPFRLYGNAYINSLVSKGILILTPGVKKSEVSISPKFLNKE